MTFLSFSVFPKILEATQFTNDAKVGSGTFTLTNLKYSTAPRKPVYKLQNQTPIKYIFFRPMPLGWSLGTKSVLDGNPKGFRSNGILFIIV